MTTVLIILFVVVLVLVGASLALGRSTYEVESARDTEYLELEGTWVRYNVIGGGPPVVLVHGWLSSSAVWDNLAGRLAQRFTVYTLDLAGFGESDKPLSGYGVRYGSRLIYAFCAHFGLNRASIIGHDLGGNMAVKLAADHPDVASRIVLVATPANEEQIDLPTPLWAATLPVIGPLFYMLGRAVRPVREMWMKPFVSEPEDLTEDVVEDAASSTPAAMSQTLKVSQREIGGGRLARQARIIKVPVLLVAGEEDQIVDPQSVGVWARSFDQADVCLMDECGHMPMIERTGEFNAQILAFLTGDARYLEYVEREDDAAADDGEFLVEEESDDTSNFDTREVPTDEAPEPVEDETFGAREAPEEDADAPAFGPPPGEEREFERRLERESPKSRSRREEEAADETLEEDDDDRSDSLPPVVRRLSDRFSGRRRGAGREDEVEPDPDPLEDETSELESPPEEVQDEPRTGPRVDDERPAPPRRRRPRRESSEDTVPEMPSDLFDWGSTWDEDIKRPRGERPPRRRRRESEDANGGPDDAGNNSNGSPDEEPPRL